MSNRYIFYVEYCLFIREFKFPVINLKGDKILFTKYLFLVPCGDKF